MSGEISSFSIAQFVVGFVFAVLVGLVSFRLRFLTRPGALAQFVLGWVIFGLGGLEWAVPILIFFLSSSILSKVRAPGRADAEAHFEKGSRRDVFQVAANGGVAGLMVVLWFITRDSSWSVGYLGSLAAATADTWGTEVGLLSNTTPRRITTLRRIQMGESGGITVAGTLAGVLGALLVAGSGFSLMPGVDRLSTFMRVVAGGILGSALDSVLGATMQVQHRCVVCGKVTERSIHCGLNSIKIRGIRWFRNDFVNFACTLTGAGTAIFVRIQNIS
jgi:uncharacterized protein (TIGR00297 family)